VGGGDGSANLRRMSGDMSPDESSPTKMRDDQPIQFESNRPNHEQINGGDVCNVIAQERPRPRRRRAATP
jgi:hypothetical protein